MITHTRTKWSSRDGVQFAPVDYQKYPASQGWTDIRHFEIDLSEYDIDMPIEPKKTIAQFASESDAIIINGCFAYQGHAVGYIVKDGVLYNENTSAPQWIDFILRDKPSIEQLDVSRIADIKLSFSATPEIVREGKIYVNVWGESTPRDVYEGRRARTAIGIKKDGTLVVVIVDEDTNILNKKPHELTHDAGLRVDELAAVMIHLGAWQAMNLDGGGSSVVAINKKVISGNKGYRPLGSCIAFKKKPLPKVKPVSRIINDIQISENFKLSEFQCKGGTQEVKVDPYLVVLLQALRKRVGRPITINSGYRTPEHNRRVGGAANSQHLLGTAVDIVINGLTPQEVADEGEKIGFTGIGVYRTFTHLDVRPNKTKWRG